jgi:hypothetical protein
MAFCSGKGLSRLILLVGLGPYRALCGCFGAGLTSLLIGPVRPVRAKIMDLLEGTAVQARSIEQSPQSCWHHCRQDSAGHQVALT